MPTAPSQYTYRIDSADKFTRVSPEWLRFAIENDAAHLTEEAVLGQSIWEHITGAAIQRLYSELFKTVRQKRTELSLPFNCDSPTLVRHMTLTLRSLGGGAIEFESRVDRVQERSEVPLLNRRTQRSEESVTICSLCRKLYIESNWLPVAEAVGRKRWLTSTPPPRLSESLCPTCEGYFG
jgi:hypothetical protein